QVAGVWRYFPARNIIVKAVNNSEIELRWEGPEKIVLWRINEEGDCVIQVTDKGHTGRRYDFRSEAESAVGKVVLQDFDGAGVFHFYAGNLVESDNVPVTDNTDLLSDAVIEEAGRCGLATADQSGIRRELGKNVRFASSARPQLDQVVIRFDEGDEA